MKETINQDIKNQEAEQASFFKIDPQNWPDLPPPIIKPKRLRNPYKLLGIVHFTDEIQESSVSSGLPSDWTIPQSKLDTQLIAKRNRERRQEELRKEVRRKATELIRELKARKADINSVREFYRSNATLLVRQRDYANYLEDKKRVLKSKPSNDREKMIKKYQKRAPKLSWQEYAKLRVWEIFATDLMAIS